MYCVHCGKPLIQNTRFCGGCGRLIDESQQAKTTVPARTQGQSKPVVSTSERLLATAGFTAVFTLMLLIALRYALYASSYMTLVSIGMDAQRIPDNLEGWIPNFGRLIGLQLPGIIAGGIVAWQFVPATLDAYRTNAPLTTVAGRLVAMTMLIIPFSLLLGFPQAGTWASYTNLLRVFVDLEYFIRAGLLFLLVAPLVHISKRAFVVGKQVNIWAVIMLVIAFVVEFVTPYFVREVIIGVHPLLPRIIAHLIAGILAVLISIVFVSVMRRIKNG